MKNILELDKKSCTGCRMCEQICPVKAIRMVENNEGFIEPVVDNNKCINCGLCSKRCPQLNNILDENSRTIEVYAAKNKNIEEQKTSSSGGIFSVLSNYVLDKNGKVYGCTLDDNLNIKHIGISNKAELNKIKGSKYVQSNTENTFEEVKEDLRNDKFVLYSGTPCQIAGLKAFLGKEYNNLITVDLVCHGVPSPKLFKAYLKWLENKSDSKIKTYEFRNKEKNAWGLTAKIVFENGKVKYVKAETDPYYKTFLDSKTYREVCYNCKYANENRVGDITLADYWGIEKEHPEFYDENGVSAILINTIKGKEIFEKVRDNIEVEKSTIEKVARKNGNLTHSSKRDVVRDNAYKQVNFLQFEKGMKKNLDFKVKSLDKIKSIIPHKIKVKIKKVLGR